MIDKILIFPSTELFLGNQLLKTDKLLELCGNQKVVLVADAAIKDLYAVALAKKLRANLLTIPSGEKTKNWDTAQTLIDQLFQVGCGRDTLLIALGGGVTTDLVGFVASIYMRSLPFISIPTTLLAMVDAAIGGKTAINTPYGKNLIGTMYPPQAIFVDFDVLQTLPAKEWLNGLAEILKMGLIRDGSLWEMAQKNGESSAMILQAILGKMQVIEQDPMEQGLRRILNFGHTIGHALEAVSLYKMPHGQAVALGCLVEAHLSLQLNYLAKEDFDSILAMYKKFALTLPKTYTRSHLLQAMAHDKKRAFGQIRFVLIDQIGHAIPFDGAYCRSVSPNELESTLDWMEQWK